jgi:hypothetical protein
LVLAAQQFLVLTPLETLVQILCSRQSQQLEGVMGGHRERKVALVEVEEGMDGTPLLREE